MIIEYSYLDENNEIKFNVIKNVFDNIKGDVHPGYIRIRESLPGELQDSYMNFHNSIHKFHSINEKPAFIIKNNNNEIFIKEYFKNGNHHRDDGPAIKYKYNFDFIGQYYLNSIWLDINKFAEKTSHLVCYHCNSFCKQKCF